MRFARKLALALWVGIVLIYGVNVLDRYRREVALFQDDMRRDHTELGRGLAAVLGTVWEREGRAAALELLARVRERESVVAITFLPTDALPDAARDGVAAGSQVSRVDPAGVGRLYTYVPMRIGGESVGVLELSEPLTAQRAYLRTSLGRMAATSGSILLMSGAVAMALGAWFIGRPIRLLAEKARRVGAGAFDGELVLQQDDELGQLAAEMNVMSARLARARTDLEAEAKARITAMEQLRHADRVVTVGKLASGVAHELGTPLNVIAHRTKLVAGGRVTGDAARENARIAHEQCERITAIVRQLLDYARRGAPETVVQEVPPVVETALSLVQSMAGRGVRLERRFGAGPLRAAIDASQVQQVVTNLLVNAIQAMPDGGTIHVDVDHAQAPPPPEVAASPNGWVRVRVRDTGVGIAPEHLPLVFDPFFTTKDVGQGTGLGLSVAWGIVREHGGFVAVESRPGEGATFSVHLPAVPA